MDPTTAAITIGSGQIIFIAVQILKVLIEKFVQPADALHDPLIQVSAMVAGIVGFLAHAWMIDTLTRLNAWDNISQGALAGLAAVASYHILGAVKGATTTDNVANLSDATATIQPTNFLPSSWQPLPTGTVSHTPDAMTTLATSKGIVASTGPFSEGKIPDSVPPPVEPINQGN